VFDVFRGGHLGGFGVAGRGVLPEVLESESESVGGDGGRVGDVLICRFHFWTALGRTEFGD